MVDINLPDAPGGNETINGTINIFNSSPLGCSGSCFAIEQHPHPEHKNQSTDRSMHLPSDRNREPDR